MAKAPGELLAGAGASSSSQTEVACDRNDAAARIDAGLEVPSTGLNSGDTGGRMDGDAMFEDSRRRRGF